MKENMRATNTCNFNEFMDFSTNCKDFYWKFTRNEIQEHFFPECESLVIFNREKYEAINKGKSPDDEYGNYDIYAGLIIAFLNYNKINECFVTGPRFYG